MEILTPIESETLQVFLKDVQCVHILQYGRHQFDTPSRSTRVSAYHGRRPYLLLLSPSGKSWQIYAQTFP
jgi:hypothetical protein